MPTISRLISEGDQASLCGGDVVQWGELLSTKGVYDSLMEIVQWLFIAGIIASLLSSVFFSLRARRSAEPTQRGLYTARMNISMGLMLLLMAGIQMVMFAGDTVRVIVGSIFLLLGLFNLFAGLRNHRHYTMTKR